jgi:hypothetical protein
MRSATRIGPYLTGRSSGPRRRRAREGGRRRERKKAADKPVVVRYRWPDDRQGKLQRWADATDTLLDALDDYQDWRAVRGLKANS